MITSVILNPTWTVPLSITKSEIIPKMRKDPSWVAIWATGPRESPAAGPTRPT